MVLKGKLQKKKHSRVQNGQFAAGVFVRIFRAESA